MTDYNDLLDQLCTNSLDASTFRHEDHIGVAYEALTRYGFFEALYLVATGIERAAMRAGAMDKFHATITLAFMSLIAERIGMAAYSDARDFIGRNGDLRQGAPLRALYSPERLASDRARQVALLPDRANPAKPGMS